MNTNKIKKRILITGSTGFLGKALVEILKENSNYEIITTNRSEYDFSDFEDCKIITKNIDVVINLAGLVLSRNEQKIKPAEVFRINTLIPLNISEAARLNGVKRVIYISSVTAYPENAPIPLQEKDLWNGPVSEGNYAYGTAKRVTETIARAYNEQYGIETCTIFLPNLYGPNDKFNFNPPPLVPNIIKQVKQSVDEKIMIIKGGKNGSTELDLLYVTDAAEAIKCLLETETIPELLNISTGKTIAIKDIYTKAAEILSYPGTIEWEDGPTPTPRVMDQSNAYNLIGWKSMVDFEDGIKSTINYYLKTLDE